MDELSFIAGCHDYHIGQASHVGDVKSTPMGCSIGSYQASSVHSEAHCDSQEQSESEVGGEGLAYISRFMVKSTVTVRNEAKSLRCRTEPTKHQLSMAKHTAPV